MGEKTKLIGTVYIIAGRSRTEIGTSLNVYQVTNLCGNVDIPQLSVMEI